MTIYEIYVHGEFYEAWETSAETYNRVVKLQHLYGEDVVHIKEIDFQENDNEL